MADILSEIPKNPKQIQRKKLLWHQFVSDIGTLIQSDRQ